MRGVLDGGPASAALPRRVGLALGVHAADVFVPAGQEVPEKPHPWTPGPATWSRASCGTPWNSRHPAPDLAVLTGAAPCEVARRTTGTGLGELIADGRRLTSDQLRRTVALAGAPRD